MKKLIYILPIFALLFASCEDFYLEKQLGYETTIEDVRNFTYTLTEADYSALANNPTNKATALALGENDTTDLIDSTYYNLLQTVGKQKYFEGKITPDEYIPAFLVQKFPQLSTGTICKVFYNIEAEKTAWYDDFQEVTTLVPASTIASSGIAAYLATAVSEDLRTEGHKYVVLYDNTNAAIYQYTNGSFTSYSNSKLALTVLTKSDYTTMGMETPEFKNVDPKVYLNIYFKTKYPYAQAGEKHTIIYAYSNEDAKVSGATVICDYVYDGAQWSEALPYFEESMSFDMKEVWEANVSIFLKEPFIGNGQGEFTIQDVLLQDPLTYVWYYSATYGMCASAYKSGASYDSESWLVSPAVKLKNAKKPALIFDQAFNKASNFTEEATVLISTDYAGDVTTATWEALEWNVNEDGTLNVPPGTSWVFQTSGDLDLSKWVDQTIYIGFRYTTSGGISGTWELQNVLVHETAVEE